MNLRKKQHWGSCYGIEPLCAARIAFSVLYISSTSLWNSTAMKHAEVLQKFPYLMCFDNGSGEQCLTF